MLPMKNYFTDNFLSDFLNWYHSNPELEKIKALSTEKASLNIMISEGFYYDGTPQTIINAKQPIIHLIDKFLFEEMHIIAYKEKEELRINMRERIVHPRI